MNIVLIGTGSISAYKSIDLMRLYIKDDHKVTVILTKGATEFTSPKIFNYLGAEQTYSYQDDFDKNFSH